MNSTFYGYTDVVCVYMYLSQLNFANKHLIDCKLSTLLKILPLDKHQHSSNENDGSTVIETYTDDR